MDMNGVLRANIRRRRKEERFSQEQVAKIMERRTGNPWSKQLVSRVESGGRRLDVNELVLLAETLETRVIDLLRPAGEVQLSPHEVRSSEQVFATVAGDFGEMTRTLEGIRERVDTALAGTVTAKAHIPGVGVTVSNEED